VFDGRISILTGAQAPVRLSVVAEDSALSLDYRLLALPVSESGGVDSTSLWISLNGLAPGAPVTGTLNLAAGDSADVIVNARFVAGDIRIPIQEVLFDADVDNDGEMETLAAIGLSPGTESAVDVPTPVTDQTRVPISAWPNPFVERTTLRFSLVQAGSPRIDIFDVTGRLVRSFAPGGEIVGPISVDWDGRDTRGRIVSSGLYFVRVHLTNQILHSRVVKLR